MISYDLCGTWYNFFSIKLLGILLNVLFFQFLYNNVTLNQFAHNFHHLSPTKNEKLNCELFLSNIRLYKCEFRNALSWFGSHSANTATRQLHTQLEFFGLFGTIQEMRTIIWIIFASISLFHRFHSFFECFSCRMHLYLFTIDLFTKLLYLSLSLHSITHSTQISIFKMLKIMFFL